jgi:hypothetical protein
LLKILYACKGNCLQLDELDETYSSHLFVYFVVHENTKVALNSYKEVKYKKS